jgi:hypothetical protein
MGGGSSLTSRRSMPLSSAGRAKLISRLLIWHGVVTPLRFCAPKCTIILLLRPTLKNILSQCASVPTGGRN